MYNMLLLLVNRRGHLESKRESKHQAVPEDSCHSAGELPPGLFPKCSSLQRRDASWSLGKNVCDFHASEIGDGFYICKYVLIKIAVNSSVRLEIEPPIDFF